METKCIVCHKKLRSFKQDDWNSRKMHKKCYKEKCQIEEMIHNHKVMIGEEKSDYQLMKEFYNL